MGQVADPRGAGEVPAAGSTERMALHPYPVCYSVPIKRAPLSGAKQAQCSGTGRGHAGFFCLGGNPNGKVGQLLSSLHPKLYLHVTLINYASYETRCGSGTLISALHAPFHCNFTASRGRDGVGTGLILFPSFLLLTTETQRV